MFASHHTVLQWELYWGPVFLGVRDNQATIQLLPSFFLYVHRKRVELLLVDALSPVAWLLTLPS